MLKNECLPGYVQELTPSIYPLFRNQATIKGPSIKYITLQGRGEGIRESVSLRYSNSTLLLLWTPCHRRIGAYMKLTVSNGKNFVNDDYELS